jgi:endonuclease YncB( thermonuclease family)
MEFGSKDPADLSNTTRVLTIMLAEVWRGRLLLTDFRGGFPRPRPSFFFSYGDIGKKSNPLIDSDTLEIHCQRIRLHGIDAPTTRGDGLALADGPLR